MLWDGPLWLQEDEELPTGEWGECHDCVFEVVSSYTVLITFLVRISSGHGLKRMDGKNGNAPIVNIQVSAK